MFIAIFGLRSKINKIKEISYEEKRSNSCNGFSSHNAVTLNEHSDDWL